MLAADLYVFHRGSLVSIVILSPVRLVRILLEFYKTKLYDSNHVITIKVR
jgi:hypothetical protein